MTTDETVEQIRAHAEAILALLPPATTAPPEPDVIPITTPEDFDATLEAAEPGDVLILATAFVYPDKLILTQAVTLQSETWTEDGPRMTRDAPAPCFQLGIVAEVDDHHLRGLELRGTDTLGVLGGTGGTWDQCRLLGDPIAGAHRGIEWRGSDNAITRCYIDDIFRPTQDCQAIAAFDAGAGLTIDDCYLSAAAQSIMFGGADPSSEDRIPTGITITHCELTKNPAWLGVQQVKCSIEFKNCRDVRVTDCVLRYAGMSQGQGGYLIVATVRNQNGKAEFSCITNIEIADCTGSDAAGIANFLGSDNNYPSGPLDGFTLHDCAFSNIDGNFTLNDHKGQGRLFLFDRSPANVHLETITVEGVNLSALGYFCGMPSPTGFVAGGMTLPTSKYGWKIDGGTGMSGSGPDALMAYMPDAILDDTIV
jgi:hypothetical protein